MKPRILIVDDSYTNLKALERLLESDYELVRASSGEECLARLRDSSPDLVLLDVVMPGLDGYETCRQIKESPVGKFTGVILFSAKGMAQDRLRGYEAGADDYLVKPFHHDELLAKVRVHFRLRGVMEELWSANGKIHQFNAELEKLVGDRSAEVVATRDVAIFALAKLAESRDPETGEHLERIQNYRRLLADELGRHGPYRDQVDATFVENLYRSSPLHDIGKVGIPDAVLLKPGRLTAEEFEIMKQHSVIGTEALEQAVRHNPSGGFLAMAIEITRQHHERFDGRGYPDGLIGMAIPLSARIVAVADVFDALTSARVYKPAYDPEVARRMIEEEEGKHFDPVIVAAFRTRYEEFLEFLQASRARESEMIVADPLEAACC